MEHTIMSRYRKTMAEALQEVSDKNKLKVLARKIKKFKDKAFSKTMSTIKSPLFADNELDEGKMKTIATMFDQGKSAEEIAKALKLSTSTVKQILGEGINPYVSMQRDSKTGKMNYVVLDKDEKEAYKTTDQRLAQNFLNKNYSKLKEEVILEFSDAMLDKLEREYKPLKGKTISVDQANKLRKIFNMIPDRALDALRKRKIPFLSGLALSRMVQKGMPVREEVELEESMIQKAKEIAKKFAGNMTKAVAEIEKLQKGLSKNSAVASALQSMNEKIKPFMISYSKNGKHAGFEDADTLPELQRKAASLRRKGFTIDKMGRYNPPVKKEETMNEADINVDNVKKGDTEKEKELKIKLDKEKDQDSLEKQLIAAQGQINILKQKIENEKNKALKPEPNRETGEVPLTVGVAYKHFKDKEKKEIKKEDLDEATKNTDFKVKMKTPSGMKMVRVTVPIKDFVVDMAKIEDAARRKVKGDMVNFDFVGDIKMESVKEGGPGSGPQLGDKRGTYKTGHKKSVMKPGAGKRPGSAPDGGQTDDEADQYDTEMGEADLTKPEIKKVHKLADKLPKDSFRDRYGKKQGDSVRYATATKMVKKKLGIKEDRRLYVETIAGLKKKAEKSGMPYSILKKVYDRGMAAWKGGHRPGASQQQWAFARVNSFVTKSSGPWGGADKDLAAKVRGSK